jgi:hypothetical protein
MSNWKNRTMMMRSGGSVNNNRMIDLLRRAKDERIDLGPLYSDKNSRGASFRTKKGILDLIENRNSGKKSLKYSRGPASLEAYTDDPYAGSGIKAGMKFRFSKGGPVQGFNTGGRVGTSKVRPSGNIIKEEIIKFDELDRPIFVKPSPKRNRPDDFYNMDLIENLVTTLPRRGINARGAASDKTVADFSSLGILGLGRNTLGGESRDLARYFQANPERYKAVMEKFDGNLNDLTKYLESDKVTAEDAELFGSTNLVEIQKNIAESREGSEDPQKVSTESEDNENTEENTEPPEQPAKERTDFELFADEIAIRDQGSYSPEAERAGQVAAMYGQIAPGQVGGFGVAEARGAAAAEATQQKIEADEREIGGALAKKRMELAAAPKYGDIGKLDLGQLGDKDITAQVYKSKNPGTGAGQYGSLFVEGSADAVVGDAFTRASVLNRQLQAMQYLFDNAEKITGGPRKVIALAESLGGVFGLNPPAGGFTNAKAAVDFLQLELAKELLGEGGKTISDTERQMVKDALGEPGATTTPAQLKTRISKVIEKLQGNSAEVRRFLDRNAQAHPAMAKALEDANARLSAKNNIVPKTAYMSK